MPQNYSVGGKYVSKEEYDEAHGVKVEPKAEVQTAAPKETKAPEKTKKEVSKAKGK